MVMEKLRGLFDVAIGWVFGLILVFIVIGIGIGAIQLFGNIWSLLRLEGTKSEYIILITDVLTLYVLVELSRSLIEYFDTRRLRLTFIVDAAIVYVIREVLIGLFKHELKPEMLYALSALLLVLGALRIGSVLVYLQDKKQSATLLSTKAPADEG